MLDHLGWPRGRRRPRPYLLVSIIGAVIAGTITAGIVQRAEETIAGYGTRVEVPVASTALEPGDVITAADVTWSELPTRLLAGTPVDDPVGRAVVSPILAGEPLADERLAPGGLSPTEALIGPGRRAIVIDLTEAVTTFALGDRVDLLAADDVTSHSARWVARDAVVVDVGDTTTTVAVDEDDAPAAARAALDGTVVLALIGEG